MNFSYSEGQFVEKPKIMTIFSTESPFFVSLFHQKAYVVSSTTRRIEDAKTTEQHEESFFKKILDWEKLPNGVFLLPLIIWGIFRTLKSGTLWTMSTANPGLTFGGFFGFPKTDAYKVLPPESYPTTVLIKPGTDFETAFSTIKDAGLEFPFVVKPDGGMVGLLVRVVEDEAALRKYHNLVQADWMAQKMVDYQTEVGVFYVRHPNEEKGQIVGLNQKVPLSVLGDGSSTIGELVKSNERTIPFENEIFEKQEKNWNYVPAKGEFFQLIFTGNRKNGARLVTQDDKIDDDLIAILDEWSHYKQGIFYGRYDIKCESLESLKRGENYAILEFNGVHSGYGHLYHCGKKPGEVYKEIKRLWNLLYDISITHHKNGEPYISFFGGWKFIFDSLKTFKKLGKWEKEL